MIGTFIFWILGAICNSIMDLLAFKIEKSIFNRFNPKFWNPLHSHTNKYKNHNKANGPAFLGSTTVFVFTTDAWHLFQFLCFSFQIIGLIYMMNQFVDLLIWHNIALFFGFKVVWGMIFELFYKYLFRN